jgi:hypothetical protein
MQIASAKNDARVAFGEAPTSLRGMLEDLRERDEGELEDELSDQADGDAPHLDEGAVDEVLPDLPRSGARFSVFSGDGRRPTPKRFIDVKTTRAPEPAAPQVGTRARQQAEMKELTEEMFGDSADDDQPMNYEIGGAVMTEFEVESDMLNIQSVRKYLLDRRQESSFRENSTLMFSFIDALIERLDRYVVECRAEIKRQSSARPKD